MAKFKNFLTAIPFGIAGAGAVNIAAHYYRDLFAANKRLRNLGSHLIDTDCGPIEYAQTGNGYPVLMVHGAMGGFDQGLWLAHSFGVDSNYHVISISRFGYLRSPLPTNANLNLQADAYARLMDALGIRQAAIFGVSAGSTSAIRFAARHPDRLSALILVCPDSPGEVQAEMPPRFVFDHLMRSDFLYWAMATYFGKIVQNAIGLVPKGYVPTPEQAAQLKMVQVGDLPVSRRIDGMIFETYTCAQEFNESISAASPYPLSRIETPVLALNALDDPIAIPENVRRLAGQMPKARLFEVPEGGHFFFGHIEEVRSQIAQFLRDNTAVPDHSDRSVSNKEVQP